MTNSSSTLTAASLRIKHLGPKGATWALEKKKFKFLPRLFAMVLGQFLSHRGGLEALTAAGSHRPGPATAPALSLPAPGSRDREPAPFPSQRPGAAQGRGRVHGGVRSPSCSGSGPGHPPARPGPPRARPGPRPPRSALTPRRRRRRHFRLHPPPHGGSDVMTYGAFPPGVAGPTWPGSVPVRSRRRRGRKNPQERVRAAAGATNTDL